VYAFFAYRLRDRTEAEDLTQQTFERALRAWSRFDPARASSATWLLAIARNLLIDHYRAAGAGRGGPGTVALEEVDPAALPVAEMDGRVLGLSPELEGALARLSDRARELIALRYGADLSGPEIAQLTGLTLANVHQILSRALRTLHDALTGA
jgi:RNA polymerase sigma-70 factor (ECF subfamily)